MEFQIGDRVELIDERGDWYNHAEVGTKGTVVGVGIVLDSCILVRFDDGTKTKRFSSRFKKVEEEPKMKYKVGDEVIVTDAKGATEAILGEHTIVTRVSYDSSEYSYLLRVKTTDGREYGMYDYRFKKAEPQITVGSKVIIVDGSYAMELVNGQPKGTQDNICTDVLGDGKRFIYEVTAVGLKLPADELDESNDTIVRRLSDDKVFFVKQRFLRRYKVEPKFKRGDFVKYEGIYYRVMSSNVVDNKVSYRITKYSFRYTDKSLGITASEESLQEVQ